ncbi:DUF3306 domain-containing protein [Variovorax sp. RA8]|uniref:DUF3306 domain-containing protein n=1 Tax=Variovorax sp. (strain JCM 16519 / RA8) TaxID=662548 RepID=UPI001319307F|nr:DUF3306 domain-containing protein [Variovorax sp. RA8]VTU18651.1 hypothetical protein RA8CHR_01769 [Variovorax sp. RA8]
MSDGFFERWSRRKQQAREGEVPDEPVEMPEPDAPVAPVAGAAGPHPSPPTEGEGEVPPAPTLADAEALNAESDFKPFLASNVAPEVKNAALKKLFADPHFNVMDGLDTYIDDYSVSTPVPESVLRQMASAKFMKLFEEQPDKNPEGDAMPDVAQSTSMEPVPSQPVATDAQPTRQEADDHHADLRLQQDDAAGAEDPRRGAG